MKYRKKPIIVDAFQTDMEVIIHTLEGNMKASVGDYIITGVNGEQYPCKPDIFEKTYELAEKTISTKDDLIFRQDAIDVITKRIENSECGESVDHNKVIADIKSLPSANRWIPWEGENAEYEKEKEKT